MEVWRDMGFKRKLKGLASKCVLGATLVAGSLGFFTNSNEAYAQGYGRNRVYAQSNDMNSALHAMGVILESGIIPSKNCRDAELLRRIGIAQQQIAWYNAINVRSQPTKLQIAPYENDPMLVFAASYYVYNKWEDKNRNGKMDYPRRHVNTPNEFIGRDKKTFYSNESLYFTMVTKNFDRERHDASMTLLDPNHNVVFSETKPITKHTWHRWRGYHHGTPELVSQHGEGKYYAAFHIDTQLLGVRGFNLMRKPENVLQKPKPSVSKPTPVKKGNIIQDSSLDNKFLSQGTPLSKLPVVTRSNPVSSPLQNISSSQKNK